ncbi:DUF1491 family protein [Pyruvatibacter sp.]|uniref:DUF1491 family protein n=1 Tax=Pyruvatibacter sp. TaxID=1981328 RepID=UPI0032EAA0F6
MHPRLRSDLRVQAMLRTATASGVFATVVQRGHEVAGAIFVKATSGSQAVRIYAAAPGPGMDDEGRPRWTHATSQSTQSEADADAYLARRSAADPDIWIIEMETADATPYLDGSVATDEPPRSNPEIDKAFRR